MGRVIEARRGVFYVLQPVSSEDVGTLDACGWHKHKYGSDKCGCPLCEMIKFSEAVDDFIPDAWWTLDATLAQATKLAMTATAQILLDRAKDRGRASEACTTSALVKSSGAEKLYEFQKAGVAYALDCFRRRTGVLFADEMGLGKTAQAITTAAALNANRVLVVCPASLCLNWVAEINRWHPSARTTHLRQAEDVFEGAGWGVINPEILISARARTAQDVAQRASPDTSAKSLKKFDKIAKAGDVALWIGEGDVPETVRLVPKPETHLTAKEPLVVQAKTVGQAILLAHEFSKVWTHVIHKRVEDLAQRERGKGLWSNLLKTGRWSVLILDEAHRYANPNAAQTIRVLGEKPARGKPMGLGLVQSSDFVIALTGTPISNRPKEIAPILQALSPSFRNTWHFKMRYCGATQHEIFVKGGKGKKKMVWSFDGASHLDEFQARVRRECMVRRLKADVLDDLPAKVRQVIPITSDALKQVSKQERLAWLTSPSTSVQALEVLVAEACDSAYEFAQSIDRLIHGTFDVNAAQIAQMRHEIGLAKLPVAIEHIHNLLETKQQLVVMAHHRDVIESLVQNLPNTVCVYGGMTAEQKQEAVSAFQAGKARVFVGGLKAAGVGLTLTAADTMVFVEDDWVPSTIEQAEARIHRIGQKSSVLFQHLVAEDTLDAMIVRSIILKQRVIDEALDQPQAPSRFPVATQSERKHCLAKVQQWAGEPNSDFDARTMQIVLEISKRLLRRPPTDGEVSLVKRLEKRWSQSDE